MAMGMPAGRPSFFAHSAQSVPAEAVLRWRELGAAGSSLVIGRSFSQESFEWVRGILETYRRQSASALRRTARRWPPRAAPGS